jgi:hypothetical protein
MSDTSRRGAQALGFVLGLAIIAGIAVCARTGHRPPATAPVYYDDAWRDPDTGDRLADDDPRLNFSRYIRGIKEQHDKDVREHPEKFAPPKFR